MAGGCPGGAFAGVVAVFELDDGIEDAADAHALGDPILNIGGGLALVSLQLTVKSRNLS